MINSVKPKTLKERLEFEKEFNKFFPDWILEYSPAFNHYYITDKKTKRKSDNISYFELRERFKKGGFEWKGVRTPPSRN